MIRTGPPARRRGNHRSNQHVNESSYLIEQQNNNSPPPPYSTSVIRFRTQCGLARQDLSVKFCSSCGQAFN